jgi:tetratricopeptide (TPR) repeat protein
MAPDARVSTSTALSLLYWWQGRLDTSLERSAEALALADELAHPSTTGYALHHAALLRLWRDEPAQARELAVRVIAVADEHELPIWGAVGTVVLGVAAVLLGTVDEGMRWVAEGLERYRGLPTPPVFWPHLLQLKAQACHRAGEVEAGLEAAREAVAVDPITPDLRIALGDLLQLGGDDSAAATAWEEARAIGQQWGAATPQLRAALRLCRLEASPELRDARLAELRSVYETLSEGLGSPDLVAARALVGEG